MLDFKNTEQENGYYVVDQNITYLFVLGILVDDFVSVDYGSLTPYLAGSVRALKDENTALRATIADLQSQVNNNNTNLVNVMARLSLLEQN